MHRQATKSAEAQRDSWIGDLEFEATKGFFRWEIATKHMLSALLGARMIIGTQGRLIEQFEHRIKVLENLAGHRNVNRERRRLELAGLHDHQARAVINNRADRTPQSVDPNNLLDLPPLEETCNICGHRAGEHGSRSCNVWGCRCNLNATSVEAGLGGPY